MPVVGTFSTVKDGYGGTITMLTLTAKVSFPASDRQKTSQAPDFRVMAGPTEIGAAWRKTHQNSEKTYLSVKLDDATLAEPIWGALLEAGDDGLSRLIWQRQ